jgi:hypothetical protein
MKSRAVRVTLFGLFLVAMGVAAYLFWMGESMARAETEAAQSFERRAYALTRAVMNLRLAEQGYVAAGQGDQFWASKADAGLAAVRDNLAALRASASSVTAQTELDSASAVVQDFQQMDRRARDYARSGQKLLASDLVFSGGLEMTETALASIDQARVAEVDGRAAAIQTIRQRQLYAIGAAAAAATLLMLLLLPSGARPAGVAAPVEERPASTPIAAADAVDPAAQLDARAEGWSAARRITETPVPTVDIGGIAGLCTELARVGDTRALPAALQHAATMLDAAGIVLWIADPDARELSPIVAHGYPPQLVTRLGTIARDAENATAAAFRTSLLQTVKSESTANGAIAAPLLTPTGCVGVMAAEVRNAGEKQEGKLAAATIIAAQLATLVGPPSSRVHDRASAGA